MVGVCRRREGDSHGAARGLVRRPGIPTLTLRGYSGQELVTDTQNDIRVANRPSVLLYAGDFDPSGEDIDRDFVQRVGAFDEVIRVALTADQVIDYVLPPQLGKADDPRAADFVARHGELVQVELEALDPDDLHGLYEDALADFWDMSAFEESVTAEQVEGRFLARLAEDELRGRCVMAAERLRPAIATRDPSTRVPILAVPTPGGTEFGTDADCCRRAGGFDGGQCVHCRHSTCRWKGEHADPPRVLGKSARSRSRRSPLALESRRNPGVQRPGRDHSPPRVRV